MYTSTTVHPHNATILSTEKNYGPMKTHRDPKQLLLSKGTSPKKAAVIPNSIIETFWGKVMTKARVKISVIVRMWVREEDEHRGGSECEDAVYDCNHGHKSLYICPNP